MKKMLNGKVLLVVFGLAIGGFILFMGSRTSSTSISISDVIVNPLADLFSSNSLERHDMYILLNYLVRKAAHFTEYAGFGFIVSSFFINKKSDIDTTVYTLLIVVFIALMDETVQYYVGRTSMTQDVLIDSFGCAFGIGVRLTIDSISKRIKKLKGVNCNGEIYKAERNM